MPANEFTFDIRKAARFTDVGATPAADTLPTYTPDTNRIELIRAVHWTVNAGSSSASIALEIQINGNVIARCRHGNTVGASTGVNISYFNSGIPVLTNQAYNNIGPLPPDLLLTSDDTITGAWLATPIAYTMSAIRVYGVRFIQ